MNKNVYYSYHGTAKKLINNNRLIGCAIVQNHNGIRPALVLYFDDHAPMPIRREKWKEYFRLILTYDFAPAPDRR